MAAASVTRIGSKFPREANTKWCDDQAWDALGGRLPIGLLNRLKSVNRKLQAMTQIQEMLFADNLGKEDQESNGVYFRGLSPSEVHALSIAVIELGNDAERLMEGLREGRFSFA